MSVPDAPVTVVVDAAAVVELAPGFQLTQGVTHSEHKLGLYIKRVVRGEDALGLQRRYALKRVQVGFGVGRGIVGEQYVRINEIAGI